MDTHGLLPSGALIENVARILSSFAGEIASFLSSVYPGQVGGKRHADIQRNRDYFTSILALAVSPWGNIIPATFVSQHLNSFPDLIICHLIYGQARGQWSCISV